MTDATIRTIREALVHELERTKQLKVSQWQMLKLWAGVSNISVDDAIKLAGGSRMYATFERLCADCDRIAAALDDFNATTGAD